MWTLHDIARCSPAIHDWRGVGHDMGVIAITPETRKLFAYRYMNRATSEDVVHWTLSLLESGYETPSLLILAGLTKPFYSSEIDEYFRKSIKELEWDFPEGQQCIRDYLKFLAESIISDYKDQENMEKAVAEIYDCVVSLGYPENLRRWIYVDEGLDPDDLSDLVGDKFENVVVREAKKILQSG